jgi:hypothetical protein
LLLAAKTSRIMQVLGRVVVGSCGVSKFCMQVLQVVLQTPAERPACILKGDGGRLVKETMGKEENDGSKFFLGILLGLILTYACLFLAYRIDV